MENTEVIVQALPNRQYQVIVDGSRRVTLRNRKFLRKIVLVARKDCIDLSLPQHLQKSPSSHHISPTVSGDTNPSEGSTEEHSIELETESVPDDQVIHASRRSVRFKTQAKFFNAKMSGQSHE